MNFICVECRENVSARDILGTIKDPYCEECWAKIWKGREEEYIQRVLESCRILSDDFSEGEKIVLG